ncbi:MAG TPA: hypothetical protein VF715_18530 [Thermoleophilaceae bacterium]
MPTDVILQLAADTEPAGGAAAGEAIGATIGALVLTALMLAVLVPHRLGRPNPLGRAATALEGKTGLPGWAALPSAISGISLLVALVGMYWDISLHIDNGRDAGPLANPAHYLILIGLFGVMFAGLVAVCLPHEKPSDVAVRIRPGWYAPLGGVLMVGCAAFSLAGFPLDDFWHRIFGQDVTLWGPTHLMLIGGASLATIASWVLFVEGTARRGPTVRRVPLVKLRQAGLAGGLLVGLSTFQAEFDFGVPQFRLLFHPILLMLAAGVALVLARIRIGRGGALVAVAGYVVIRGIVTLLVGPVFGQTLPHMPLYVVEALLVEAVALRVSTDRPLAFGALAGAAIGTVGLAAEWGWSHLWMPFEWPAALLPEAAILGFVTAVAAGTIGGAMGRAFRDDVTQRAPRGQRPALAAAALVIVAAIAYTLPVERGEPVSARVSLEETRPAPQREVVATVRLDPAGAARDAEWFNVTAWQGEGSRLVRMDEIAPGTYRSAEPIPVHGTWKSILRLHRGDSIAGMPVFMPEDRAIPAAEVPAPRSFERAFVLDRENLQREQKEGVAGGLTTAAYLVVLAIVLALLTALTISMGRLSGGRSARVPDAGRRDVPTA